MTLDLADPNTRRAHAARELWGCPRPDKTHFMTRASAERQLEWNALKPTHDPTAQVYRCACGGYVWGRRRK